MKHRFFTKTTKQQFAIQCKIVAFAMLCNIILGAVFFTLDVSFLMILSFSITLSIIAPFIDVPSGVKSGSLHYYSPLLIGETVKNGMLTLHSGTLFDYYYVLDKNTAKTERKKQIYRAYIQGLINLIEKYEKTCPNAIKIKVTSYILNTRTAQKIGMQPVTPGFLQRIILYYNYFNLLCSLSLLNAKLSFPNLGKLGAFVGDLDELINKKQYLIALKNRL
jgi:hypothetical protein